MVKTSKKVSSREWRRELQRTQVGLQVLADSIVTDFQQLYDNLTVTRQFLADLSARLDALEARAAVITTTDVLAEEFGPADAH